jgi:hypothetical protein
MLPRIPARHWRQAALTGKRLASAAGAPQRGQGRGDAPAGTPSAKIAALAGQPHAAANAAAPSGKAGLTRPRYRNPASRPEAVRRAGTPGARPWTNRGE